MVILMTSTRRQESLARPGYPTHYSMSQASHLLGLSPRTIVKMLENGDVIGERSRVVRRRHRVWEIPRSEVCRIAQSMTKDRTMALARVMAGPKGRLLAMCRDMKVRKVLAAFNPRYYSSPFDLGMAVCHQPATVLVIDWEAWGSDLAKMIAEKVSMHSDRPALIGILPEDVSERSRLFDHLLERPVRSEPLIKAMAHYYR